MRAAVGASSRELRPRDDVYHGDVEVEPAARDLREAADLSPDKAFANFLRLRSEALLSDDYFKSDIAWMQLKDPKVDIIFAPYVLKRWLLFSKTAYASDKSIKDCSS